MAAAASAEPPVSHAVGPLMFNGLPVVEMRARTVRAVLTDLASKEPCAWGSMPILEWRFQVPAGGGDLAVRGDIEAVMSDALRHMAGMAEEGLHGVRHHMWVCDAPGGAPELVGLLSAFVDAACALIKAAREKEEPMRAEFKRLHALNKTA